jgi:hypothetical protein
MIVGGLLPRGAIEDGGGLFPVPLSCQRSPSAAPAARGHPRSRAGPTFPRLFFHKLISAGAPSAVIGTQQLYTLVEGASFRTIGFPGDDISNGRDRARFRGSEFRIQEDPHVPGSFGGVSRRPPPDGRTWGRDGHIEALASVGSDGTPSMRVRPVTVMQTINE